MFLALLCLAGRLAGAVELVSIPPQDGKLQLSGHWFKASASEPRPTVITLHGCSGALDEKGNLNKNWIREAGYFNAEKMHLLVLDSFTPRGQKSICEMHVSRRSVHEEDRRDDVFAAMRWLAQRTDVDLTRIAVIGRSHGGSVVLSTLDRSDKSVQAQTLKPKAAIALYPGCAKFTKMWDYELSAPLLLMIGALDDWTPSKYCVTLQEKVQRAQKDASFEMHVFPDSHHAFDGMAPVRVRTNIGNTRNGTATVGGNPEYREKAHRRMFEFISEQFGTPLLLTHEERLRGRTAIQN